MKLRRMMAVMGIMAMTVGACGKSSDKNTDKSPETQKVSEAASQSHRVCADPSCPAS